MNESQLYHIFTKEHEVKHSLIYIVQLDVRVSNETFVETNKFAKALKGYYSSFKGVNGFVFGNKKDACYFGKKLDGFLYIPDYDDDNDEEEDDDEIIDDIDDYDIDVALDDDVDDDVEEEQETTETKEVSLNNLCTSLHLLIEDKGVKILSDTIHKTIETLNSVGAFEGLPPSIKFILRTFIMKQYGKKLISEKKSEEEFQQLISDFVYEHGFQQDLAEAVFDCVRDAINGLDETQGVITITTTYSSSPKPTELPKSTIPLKQQEKRPKAKNFYSYDQHKFIFNVKDNVGNPDFAIFRRKVERLAGYFSPNKIAFGYEFGNKADLKEFVSMVKDINRYV